MLCRLYCPIQSFEPQDKRLNLTQFVPSKNKKEAARRSLNK